VHHLRYKLIGDLGHKPPIEPRVGTARRRRPTSVADLPSRSRSARRLEPPLNQGSGAAAPEVGDADGAASLPIFTKALVHHLRCKLIGDLARQSPIEPRVGTARPRCPTSVADLPSRSRSARRLEPPLNQGSGAAAPEVGDTDGAVSLPIFTKVLVHHLRCNLTGDLARQSPIEPRVGTARPRRPTSVADLPSRSRSARRLEPPLYPRSGAAAPEVGDAAGAASLPIFTKVLLHHLRCNITGDLARQSPIDPRVGTARRRRPTSVADLPSRSRSARRLEPPLYPRSGAAAPEVGDTDGAASLPIFTKALVHHLRCNITGDLARQSPIEPRVGTARRRRPTPAPHPFSFKSASSMSSSRPRKRYLLQSARTASRSSPGLRSSNSTMSAWDLCPPA